MAGGTVWVYSLISVVVVSFISFIGLFTLSIEHRRLRRILIYLVSFSAGALFGDAFLHLIPETIEVYGLSLSIFFYVLFGLVLFFVLEKVVYWRHCHLNSEGNHECYPFAYMNLIGDGLHNLLDGVIIAASYMASIPVGIATTLAVIFHEIPQEIGDFGVLLHGGFTRKKALAVNFLTALAAVFGAIIALVASRLVDNIGLALVPVAAGGFIYIAGSDLIPELHKEFGVGKSVLQLLAFVLGIGVMAALLLLQ